MKKQGLITTSNWKWRWAALFFVGLSLGLWTCELNKASQFQGVDPVETAKFDSARAACVERINGFRATISLPPLQRWTEGELCADTEAKYDSEGRGAHAGFRANLCDDGFAQNECLARSSVENIIQNCLQSMWNEGPSPTGEWDQEHGHYMNMANPDYDRVACGFYEMPDGHIWALQNFK